MIDENKDYRGELQKWIRRQKLNEPPSERNKFAEQFDAGFRADYIHWREGGHNHASAMDRAGTSQENRDREKAKAKADKEHMAVSAPFPRLPLRGQVDEAVFKKNYKTLADEWHSEIGIDLSPDILLDRMYFREKRFSMVWDGLAQSEPNPFGALQGILLLLDKFYEQERLIARQKRVDLEARVAEMESRSLLYDAGVWKGELSYSAGAVVTDKGSAWVCRNANLNKRPGENDFWRLLVKQGRPGRDADEAEIARRLLPEIQKTLDRQ